ncbi:hypothetical protein ACQZ6B_22520 [Agrobacterium vitis]
MGLLSEIQNDAVNSSSNVAAMLRKCLILAARVDSGLLEDWVKYELNGYPEDADVPDYRDLQLSFKGHFSGPLGAHIKNAPIAPHVIEQIVGDERFSKFLARQPITTISDTEKARNAGVLHVNFDNLALLVGQHVYRGYSAVQVWGEVPSMGVIGIIEAVKSRILELTLALEKKYPNAGEVGGMDDKDQKVRNDIQAIFNNSIYGNVGFVGNASHSTINVQIGTRNIEALTKHLEEYGINKDDLIELETALQSEPQIGNDKKFGPKVTSWIGKMVQKAASGAWDVSVGASSSILATALLKFYGFG